MYEKYYENLVTILNKLTSQDHLALFDLAETHLVASNILSRKDDKLDPFSACITVTRMYASNAKRHNIVTKEVLDGLHRHLYQADGQFLPLSDEPDAVEYLEEIFENPPTHIDEYLAKKPFVEGALGQKFTIDELCILQPRSFTTDLFKARALRSPILEHFAFSKSTLNRLISNNNQNCERLVGELKIGCDVKQIFNRWKARKERPRSKGANINLNPAKKRKSE